jgi:hypothetical protein
LEFGEYQLTLEGDLEGTGARDLLKVKTIVILVRDKIAIQVIVHI